MATPPDFTAGQVLTAAQMNGIGLWLVKSQTVGTGVSSVNVTSAFTADFDNYRIHWNNGTLSAQTSLEFKLGASTSTYNYKMLYGSYANATVAGSGKENQAKFEWCGGGDSNFAVMDVTVFQPFLTKYTGICTNGFYNPNVEMGIMSGVHKTATSYSDFTLTPSGGATMTGGTIYVYGYRNV